MKNQQVLVKVLLPLPNLNIRTRGRVNHFPVNPLLMWKLLNMARIQMCRLALELLSKWPAVKVTVSICQKIKQQNVYEANGDQQSRHASYVSTKF